MIAMSSDESLPDGAGKRVNRVLALFEKNAELLAFCVQHQHQMTEVKTEVKKYVPDVTAEDIQGALKKYAEQRIRARRKADDATDGEFKRLRDGLQNGLLEVVEQIDRGYRITMWMYTAAFIMGMLMLAASMLTALLRDVHSAILLGGLGAADVLTFLIFKPAQDLQASRGGLAQLQATFFAWINDIHNWNEYLDVLRDEAGASAPPFDKCRQISEIQGRSTEQMVRLIGEHTNFAPGPGKAARHVRAHKTEPPAGDGKTG
jgi:hypothetical protein